MLGQSILQQHTVKLTFIEINLSYNACLFIYGRKDCGLIGLGVRTDNGSYTELSICPSLHPFIHGSWDRLLPTRNSYTGKMNICLLLDLLFFLHICIKLILILDKDTLSKNKMEFFKNDNRIYSGKKRLSQLIIMHPFFEKLNSISFARARPIIARPVEPRIPRNTNCLTRWNKRKVETCSDELN